MTFELASAVLDGVSDVFDSSTAAVMTGTRNSLEYLDTGHPAEVTEADARWAVQVARRAVHDAASYREIDANG